jgi:putative hydrolase of the HAD superfamily
MSEIKLIIFDLEKVIIGSWQEIFEMKELRNLSKGIINKCTKCNEMKELQSGRLTEDEYLEHFIQITKTNLKVEDLKKLIRKTLNPVITMTDLVKYLKLHYKVALLSNYTKEWAEYVIKKYDLNKLFDGMFWSFQNKIKKPSTQSYLEVLEKFDVKPKESLFIDDKERNIRAAKSLGIKTIIFSNPKQLKEELERFNIV